MSRRHLLAWATILVVGVAAADSLRTLVATTLTGALAAGVLARPAGNRPARIGTIRILRASWRLITHRRRLKHLPTIGQIKAMAWLDGREPVSYLLDREQNFVPEPLDFGYERELGTHALNFTVRDDDGCFVTEMVAMSDGETFDLLASVW
ncbi:MAG: hypothetical protein JO168_07170 [Solirubrobacterales bacterium]|nr:hypothetical protein [Solirubrobacterales bacterium]